MNKKMYQVETFEWDELNVLEAYLNQQFEDGYSLKHVVRTNVRTEGTRSVVDVDVTGLLVITSRVSD